MRLLGYDFKKGYAKIKVENLDDLWYLSHIIDPGDLASGRTLRKIKLGEDDRKAIRKPVFIKIKVEKIDYGSDLLKVLGIVVEGPEDVPKGSHHSFNVEENTIITLEKEKWLKFQITRLKEACEEKIGKILIVAHDREEAYFAMLKKGGYELLSQIKGSVQKKGDESKVVEGHFYIQVIEKIKEYVDRYNVDQIIIASPAFWKEDLMKHVKDDELKKNVVFATCSSVGKSAINEVLKRDELKEALKQDRISKEMKLVDSLLAEIRKNNLAAYGLNDVENAINAGAVKDLLITDAFINKMREEGKYERIDVIMKVADQMKAEIYIISSEHEGGKKLDGLGGMGAILRYRLSY